MAARLSGRARIAGMARSCKALLQATSIWDIAFRDVHGVPACPGYGKKPWTIL
ncbi:hypothetical protein HP532_04185 [Pseudomonas sp. CrR25]|nr:hypothetical protein [Pseudomonas sp. CrR25]